MHPCCASPWSRPSRTPPVWIACMVLMCGELQALVPNAPDPSLVSTTPRVPEGVQSTPLTPKDVSGDELTNTSGNVNACKELHSICDGLNLSRPNCYKTFIKWCDSSFSDDMKALNSSDWCMWDKVKSTYNTYTECTEKYAECLLLPWPNRVVEEKFVEIHSKYFQECPTETLRDPPPNVVLALVMTPICLIPAMVVFVVMKTKNGDRRS
ncbi:LOW QUALITY PROTEIN: receptor activity-modifying protein 2 [Electrophorus electricus]|uniref:LOW QUALITY PROTEIN: receptor activity-modifying protein 2 n=1 Tax=Electrophorus electricus TaxID=8005 RepID=UPI0015D05369|nr:LOW QUALITY PROTEIN: receptor activity-modifying protein 2 [Electrophorus electricus]